MKIFPYNFIQTLHKKIIFFFLIKLFDFIDFGSRYYKINM